MLSGDGVNIVLVALVMEGWLTVHPICGRRRKSGVFDDPIHADTRG
jgi:hypothetical protein